MVHVFDPFGAGTEIIASHTLIMLAWGIGALLVSLHRFRWEPRIAS